jgi:hypothetical protein
MSSPNETYLARDFVDYDSDTLFSSINSLFNIALEQQESDELIFEEGISGSGLFFPDDPKNLNGSYKRLVYHQVLRGFYNNYKNPTKIFGLENVDFPLSRTLRYLGTQCKVFTLPQILFGEKMVKGSIEFVDNTYDDDYTITDDFHGNLFAKSNLFSKVQEVRKLGNDLQDGVSSHTCPPIPT